MTALLYYSISSNLTEDEIIEIESQVANNRETVCTFVINLGANVKDKTKRVILIIGLASGFWFGNLESAEAIGLAIPPAPVVRSSPDNYHYHYSQVKIATIIPRKKDLVYYESAREIVFLMYLTDPKISSNDRILGVVKRLRGGSWEVALGIVGIIILILVQSQGFIVKPPADPRPGLIIPDPFQPNQYHERQTPVAKFFRPRRTLGSQSRYPSTLQITRPSAMPHQEFSNLTKEERRALPHSNDMKITCEGYPELHVGFYQSKFKVDKHGAIHGLPYTIKENGETKTEKTDDNALKMMRSIVDMPNRDNVRWFEDGTYQGNTSREFEAIHIYDLDEQVIAVFNKSTGKFVTTCKLTTKEDAELKATGNFGGGKGWLSGQVKNLPPKQTAVNTFESDVTGITPVSSMNENSSPNPGFTPMSSFESDVMNITPIDNSQFDNP